MATISLKIIDRHNVERAVIPGKSTEQFTVKLLKGLIEKKTRIPVIRQYLTFEGAKGRVVLSDNDKSLISYGISADATLVLKDLGPQMLWSTVFYLEYLAPIIAFLALYIAFYPAGGYSLAQNLGFAFGIAHFVKRELETAFVHHFSKDSMPVKRAFINFFHYGILFGANVGVELFRFWSNPGYCNCVVVTFSVLWAVCELMNLRCHIILKNLRTQGTKERGIPYGSGFDLVSSANYFWEVMSWLWFSLLVRCYTCKMTKIKNPKFYFISIASGYFFLICSTYQMLVWAIEKQSRYKQEFGDKFPRKRKAMIPFIL